MIRKRCLLLVCVAIFSFTSQVLVFSEESKPISGIEYRVPQGWHYEDGRERWQGDDPTFNLSNGRNITIKVTHYGLEGSRFKMPADFEAYLNKIFSGEQKNTKGVVVSGKTAKSILLRYKRDEFTDHHGAFIPREYVYDEFVMLPLREGFLVFNLAIYSMASFPALIRPDDEWYLELEKKRARIISDWRDFLKSCRINRGGIQ